MIIITLLFSDKIKEQAQVLIDDSIDGTFEFSDAKVSFFSHFPTLAVTLSHVVLHTVPGFDKDTLISSKEISLGVDLLSIFGNNIKVSKIYANEPKIAIILNNSSVVNDNDSLDNKSVPNSGFSLLGGVLIESINIKRGQLSFVDKTSNLSIELSNLDYKGRGSLKGKNISLRSRVEVESLVLFYQGVNYIDKKRIKAKLLTRLDREGMNFKLVKNRVQLEELVASFNGELKLFEDGYSANVNLSTKRASFKDILSLLPSNYSHWLSSSQISGDAQANIVFSGQTKEGTALSPNLDLSFDIYNGKIMNKEAPVPIENIRLSSSISMSLLDIESLDFKTDTLSFNLTGRENKIAIQIKGISTPIVNIVGNGSLNLDTLSKALGLNKYYTTGTLNYNIFAQGELDKSNGKIPNCDINISLTNGSFTTPYTTEKLEEIDTELSIKNSTGTLAGLKLSLKPMEFKFAESPFYLECDLENFEDLNYNVTSRGSLDLDKIALLFGVKNAKVKGKLDANLYLNGKNAIEGVKTIAHAEGSGTLILSNFEYSSANYPFPVQIPNSEFDFDQDRAILKNSTIKYGVNTMEIYGYASNFINFFIANGDLSGALEVAANSINLKDFTSIEFEETNSDITRAGVILLPEKINLSLRANIKQINYESIKAKNFKGEVAIAKGILFINGTGVNIAGAQFRLDATYQPIERVKANLEFHARADSFDIARAYREIPMMRELFSTASSLEGLVSVDYKISTTLDSLMTPIYPSVKGKGYIKLENVNVKGLKVLGAISKAVGRDSLNNPNLKAVLINTSIKNNIVTIDRTRMRVFGFRPRFEGQTTLDGRLNIKMRLGLPPLGIIGIPITVTGTFENPIVNIRRGKDGDILYEQEYNSNN